MPGETSQNKVTLFISHASEDKVDFVEPLAIALQKYFQVWYDRFVLKVGDSLREKIDEGLRTSDFGVVVLSKYFFSKKWTSAELDGLFALEQKNQKLILPVWYNVTFEEVSAFSPMLAGRLSAKSSELGLDGVVESLRVSVESSLRTREIDNQNPGRRALFALSDLLTAREEQRKHFGTAAGVESVIDAAAVIADRLAADIDAVNVRSDIKRFDSKRHSRGQLEIRGPHLVTLMVMVRNMPGNMVHEATLSAKVYVRGTDMKRQSDLEELDWRPRFSIAEGVTWEKVDAADEKRFASLDVASMLLAAYIKAISDAQRDADGRRSSGGFAFA